MLARNSGEARCLGGFGFIGHAGFLADQTDIHSRTLLSLHFDMLNCFCQETDPLVSSYACFISVEQLCYRLPAMMITTLSVPLPRASVFSASGTRPVEQEFRES